MKKFLLFILLLLYSVNDAKAVNMVKKENYLKYPVSIVGLPDYPPFSYYEANEHGYYNLRGAFIKPIKEAMNKYGFALEIKSHQKDGIDLLNMLIDVRSGKEQLFIGTYADTRLFSGIENIYPAALSNPIHVITLPEKLDSIKSTADLKNLKGVLSKSEYLSDFVLRKIKQLDITFTETSYDAYELLFTGEADYIIGSLYYNRIEASKYGLDRYLAYSKNPLFKIPVFVGLSKSMSMFSQYQQAFNHEFSNPEFSNAVKTEVLRIVDEFIVKNDSIVPPAFIKNSSQNASDTEDVENSDEEQKDIFEPADDFLSRGYVVDKKEQKQHKTIQELLDDM